MKTTHCFPADIAFPHWRAVCAATTLVVAAALGGGCALKPAPQHAEVVEQALPPGTGIPSEWKAAETRQESESGDSADETAARVSDNWLKSFNDPALDAIVAEAIAHNPDLQAAASSVEIAQQAVIAVGARLLPQVGAQLGAETINDAGRGSNFNSNSAYAGVAWELDLWGRLRAKRAAAEATYQATALDYAYARQSLAATVAKAWTLATGTHQLVALSEQSVVIFQDLLNLVSARRAAGKDSDLDLVFSQANLATANSGLEAALQADGEARRALEVLLGRYPAAEIETAANFLSLPPSIGAGLPASLLERRPDVLAAEREVLAAFRQQEAAQLALLPDLSISLLGGRLDNGITSLLGLNPWLASAAIGMSIPIYQGGALRANIRIATAQQAQAVAQYGAVTLNAFREVENALANDVILLKRLPFEQSTVADRTRAVNIATVQYKAGRQDLLWVANLQTAQIAAQATLIKLSADQRLTRIRLHLALGGSFDGAPAKDWTSVVQVP